MSPENVNQIVCNYEKFGFCKMREQCQHFHPKENCIDDNCSIVNCKRRHPQPCRFFGTKSGCRFGSACRFDHQTQMFFQMKLKEMQDNFNQYKEIQDQTVRLLNERILSLENNLLGFMKDTLVCDDKVTDNIVTSKKRKVTISNKIDDDQDTAVQSDIEMTECNEKLEYQNIFCDNSYKNLKVLESKIKTSKIEDTKKCLKNIKEKYKDFQKNDDNDDVNALFQNDDIKTFVQKVEATHNKWNTYTRNNFKMKSNMDVQDLFKYLEKVRNKGT